MGHMPPEHRPIDLDVPPAQTAADASHCSFNQRWLDLLRVAMREGPLWPP